MGRTGLAVAALLTRSVLCFVVRTPGQQRALFHHQAPPRVLGGRAGHVTSAVAAPAEVIQTYKDVLRQYRKTGKEWERVRDVGNTSWSGLLPTTPGADGLDPLLRLELVKYGDLNQAVYANFDKGKEELHRPQEMLPNVSKYSWSKIADRYEVLSERDYFYASAELYGKDETARPTWLGFIAITKDEAMEDELHGKKDIVVVFRGTIETTEWIMDALILPQQYNTVRAEYKYKEYKPTYKETNPHIFGMHTGFYDIYTTDFPVAASDSRAKTCSPQSAIRERLLTLVKENEGKIGSITFVGHSLGGALAAVCAADIGVLRKYYAPFQEGDWKTLSLAAYTFAGPRVADQPYHEMLRAPRFKDAKEPMVPLLNVANIGDVVPCIPAGLKVVPNTISGSLLTYVNTLANGYLALRTKGLYWTGVKIGDQLPGLWQYTDSGKILLVDSAETPAMRKIGQFELGPHHNLDGYVYNLASQHTSSSSPAFFRDYALLNRDQDLLNEALVEQTDLFAKWGEEDSKVKDKIRPVELESGNFIFENKDKPRFRGPPSDPSTNSTTRLGAAQ